MVLSAVGVGLPYSLHRTFHVLPLRPLCGAGARLKFSFQGSTPFGAPASFRSVYVTQEDSPWICLCPLDILNCTTGLSACQVFFSKIFEFFSLALRLVLRCPVSISDYRITQGCKLVKYFFQKIRKKIGGKNLLYFFTQVK